MIMMSHCGRKIIHLSEPPQFEVAGTSLFTGAFPKQN